MEIPLTIPAGTQTIAAEAPDGAVFIAAGSKDNPAPTAIWVIDGNGPPSIAEHVNGGIAALAADASNLYVATDSHVYAFNRTSGNATGTWSLPIFSTANTSDALLVSMSATGGSLLATIPLGSGEGIYRINPTQLSTPPQLIAQGSSAAFGPNGSVYFERSDHHLIGMTSNGTSTVGPVLVDAPNGEGGGVQMVNAVAGGLVWVSQPAGQGLDTQLSAFDATTLQPMGTFSGSVTDLIVDTLAGSLVLEGPEGGTNCAPPSSTTAAPSCVYRFSSSATLTDPTQVGRATQLVGPDPAVVTENIAGTLLQIDRLS